MVTKICEKCDSEMKLIPAGISKMKGKPYAAFWSCDKRNGGCGNTARAEGEEASPAPAYPGYQSAAPADNERLTRIEEKLDEVLGLLQAMR